MGAVAVRDLLLLTTLEAAVPLWIHRVRGWTPEYRQQREKVCGQAIAEHGDIIQYKSKKKGESAAAFNKLAEGLALLSFAPGGVKFCGLHWDAALNIMGAPVAEWPRASPPRPRATPTVTP